LISQSLQVRFQTSYPSHYGTAFVSKLDPSGSHLVYSTFLNGTSSGAGIAVDSSGSAYVAGYGDFFDLGNMRVVGTPRYTDIFAVKINPAGSALSYATSMNGSWDDQATGITLDHDGNVWITGWSESIDFSLTSPVQAISGLIAAGHAAEAEAKNAVIIKLDSDGAPVFSTYLGGRNNEETPKAVAVDFAGTAYVTGHAGSEDFPTTPGASGIRRGTALTSLSPRSAPCRTAHIHSPPKATRSAAPGVSTALLSTLLTGATGSRPQTNTGFRSTVACRTSQLGPDRSSIPRRQTHRTPARDTLDCRHSFRGIAGRRVYVFALVLVWKRACRGRTRNGISNHRNRLSLECFEYAELDYRVAGSWGRAHL
jgi:hypothetical protein